MYRDVDTKKLPAVRDEVAGIYRNLFPTTDSLFVHRAFGWAEDCFLGRFADYQPIDAKYHDLQHTLQVTLCFARLLQGYKKANTSPELTRRMFELGLLAILLHDTGYLKNKGDTEGTGAKYTLTHVVRSAEFARRLLTEKGLPTADIQSVQNMIRCTGVNADLKAIPFQDELERKIGFALGTADLLGQMAAEDYIDKLDILYQEFEESNRFNGKKEGPGVFTSAQDLKSKTPLFWEKYVIPKIDDDFAGLYKLLSFSDPNGANHYIDRIKQNIQRLKQQLSAVVA